MTKRRTSIPAEIRKARKVLRKPVITARCFARLPAIARREVEYHAKDWRFDLKVDALFNPAMES